LCRKHCQVLVAASGSEALDLLVQHKVDLLVTDLVMPGMDGMALIRRARDTYDAIKTIIITAYGSSESMAEAKALGVSYYLAKPFDLSELKSRVDELLASGATCRPSWVGSGGRGALQLACGVAGRGLGAMIGLARKGAGYVKPKHAALTSARAKEPAPEVCESTEEQAVAGR
jgi:CheY-like chemotaxis protein